MTRPKVLNPFTQEFDLIGNFDIVNLDDRELCDLYGIYISDGSLYHSSSLSATSFIDCDDAISVTVRMPILTTSPSLQGFVWFDSNKLKIDSVSRSVGNNGYETKTFIRPTNAKYFRTIYWNYTNRLIYGDWICQINFRPGTLGYGKYRPYQSNRINFSLRINQSFPLTGSSATMQDSMNLASTTGVLVLPSSYKNTGKPTKLIAFFHGSSRNVTMEEWGMNDSNFLAQKNRWLAAGYAIVDVNGQRDNAYANIYTSGTPQAVSAWRKAVEYVQEYYNVEQDIYVIGGSMGGVCAINYCMIYGNVKGLALISAWTNLPDCAWGQGFRDEFVTYFGFNNTTTYEEDKVRGWDPGLRITSRVDYPFIIGMMKCPVKYWVGSLESASVLFTRAIDWFIPALKNAGHIASFRVIEGFGHEIVSGGSEIVDNEIILFLDRL